METKRARNGMKLKYSAYCVKVLPTESSKPSIASACPCVIIIEATSTIPALGRRFMQASLIVFPISIKTHFFFLAAPLKSDDSKIHAMETLLRRFLLPGFLAASSQTGQCRDWALSMCCKLGIAVETPVPRKRTLNSFVMLIDRYEYRGKY